MESSQTPDAGVIARRMPSREGTSAKRAPPAGDLAFLARATRLLSSSLEYEETIRSVTRMLVPRVADSCLIYVTMPDGECRLASVAHADGARPARVREVPLESRPLWEDPDSVVGRVLRRRRGVLLRRVAAEWVRAPFVGQGMLDEVVDAVAARSALVVPLVARDRALGVMVLATGAESGRRYGPADLVLVEELAHAAALAVDNALLFRAAKRARGRALEVARRAALVARASDVLAASVDCDFSLSHLAELLVHGMADWCLVDVIHEDGCVRRLGLAHRDPADAELARRFRELSPERMALPDAEDAPGRGAPLLARRVTEQTIRHIAPNAVHEALLHAIAPSSMIVVPLMCHGCALGVISMISTRPERLYGRADLKLAEQLANRAATALDNARLWREANAANQAKADFLAMMSHEFRTPLTAVLAYAELLASGVDGVVTERQRKHLGRVREGAQHLLELIEAILDFVRLESGSERLRVKRLLAESVASEALSLVEPAAAAKGLAIRLESLQHGTTLATDPGRLRQILVNLLSNAIKYTDAGAVRLRIVAGAEDVVFAVEDTGIGIQPHQLEQVFEPFWQAEPSMTRRHGGTGLGLTVTRRIAQLIGGDIAVESVPGAGSTFKLRLPRMTA